MNKPHQHAEFIKAWADGADIEIRCPYATEKDLRPWRLVLFASEFDWKDCEYRIKP